MLLNPERDHQDHPLPPEEESWEMSFEMAMRKAVDDLFTCEAIGDRVKSIEDEERVEHFLDHHKQILIEHLVETAGRTVNEIVTALDNPQDLPNLPSSTPRDDAEKRV